MFLDQDEIDRLQKELSIVTAKVNLAQSAKDKVKIMFYDTTGSPLHSKLDNLDEIGSIINTIDSCIKTNSKYFDSFSKLKFSYLKKV